jgi:hypothetical protein
MWLQRHQAPDLQSTASSASASSSSSSAGGGPCLAVTHKASKQCTCWMRRHVCKQATCPGRHQLQQAALPPHCAADAPYTAYLLERLSAALQCDTAPRPPIKHRHHQHPNTLWRLTRYCISAVGVSIWEPVPARLGAPLVDVCLADVCVGQRCLAAAVNCTVL